MGHASVQDAILAERTNASLFEAALDVIAAMDPATKRGPFPRQKEIDSIIEKLKTTTDPEEYRRLKAAVLVLSYSSPAPVDLSVAKWDLLAGFPGRHSFLRRVGGSCHKIYIVPTPEARAVMYRDAVPPWHLDTNRRAELRSGTIFVPAIGNDSHYSSLPIDVDELFWVMMFTKIKFSTEIGVFAASQAI